MADDKKKSKIDLKARLGKSSMSGASGAGVPVPLPVPGGAPGTTPIPDADGGAPAAAPAPARTPSTRPAVGIAPPPGMSAGLSPGIPVPPFAQQKQQAAAPKPTAVQQTIKVEESEVIHQERQKASKKIALFAVIGAVAGVAIGYGVGGLRANSATGEKAVRTAGDLEKDVKAANEKLQELASKLEQASTAFKTQTFPDQVVTDLGGLVIPFDADTLGLKVGGVAMPTKYIKPLVTFTVKCREVNDLKDEVKNSLGSSKVELEKFWKELKEPVFDFSVIFAPDGSKGIQAELVSNKEPFVSGKDWPANYAIMVRGPQGKPAEKKATRWVKGDLTGSDPVAIPVAPASVAGFSTEEKLSRLIGALVDLRKKIEGDKADPQDTGGILKEGQILAEELHKASLAR